MRRWKVGVLGLCEHLPKRTYNEVSSKTVAYCEVLSDLCDILLSYDEYILERTVTYYQFRLDLANILVLYEECLPERVKH